MTRRTTPNLFPADTEPMSAADYNEARQGLIDLGARAATPEEWQRVQDAAAELEQRGRRAG